MFDLISDLIFSPFGLLLLVFAVAFLSFYFIAAHFYKLATKEEAFVRTGFGGEKVVMTGGAIVWPLIQEFVTVNMSTLKLEVRRENEQALITQDRMRVDVSTEFYVRVKANPENVSIAAQTLGSKTMYPKQLAELIEGKFVDALRAVAAEMKMEELHEQRTDFIHKVQQSVSSDLAKNGLELESVSLTGLDQTSIDYFNPKNAFDAEGLVRLTEITTAREKQRNDIEQNSKLAIETKNLQAERAHLQLIREQEYARFEQEREIAIRRAQEDANVRTYQINKDRETEEARILADKELDLKRLLVEQDIRNQIILMQKVIELAEQERNIAIAEKSRAESQAKAEADKARASAVLQEETVQKVRETERAERAKAVELIAAQEAAQKDAIAVKVAAAAEKQAALDRAEAMRIVAKGEADAKLLMVGAQEQQYRVDAEGTRAVNEAANTLSDEQIDMQIRLSTLKHLPDIIRESVKPMENIDDIKILQVNGLGGFGSVGGGMAGGAHHGDNGHNVSLSDQMVNSALRYRSQAPLVDSLLKEIGLNGGDINGLTQGLHSRAHHNDDVIEQVPNTPPSEPVAEPTDTNENHSENKA